MHPWNIQRPAARERSQNGRLWLSQCKTYDELVAPDNRASVTPEFSDNTALRFPERS